VDTIRREEQDQKTSENEGRRKCENEEKNNVVRTEMRGK
jgi:hypothetical protein